MALEICNSMKLECLRFMQMGLVDKGAYDVNQTIVVWILIYVIVVDRVTNLFHLGKHEKNARSDVYGLDVVHLVIFLMVVVRVVSCSSCKMRFSLLMYL